MCVLCVLHYQYVNHLCPSYPVYVASGMCVCLPLFFIQTLSRHLFVPQRSTEGPFLYAVDHCFPIRGQGTVMTGTILRGSVQINDVSGSWGEGGGGGKRGQGTVMTSTILRGSVQINDVSGSWGGGGGEEGAGGLS